MIGAPYGDYRVLRGVDPAQLRAVAELFYGPFGRKLSGVLLPRRQEAAIRLTASALCPGEVYAAMDHDGVLMGIAIVRGRAPVLCPCRADVVDAFGRLSGGLRWLVYSLAVRRARPYPRSTRSIEGLVVRESSRGRGIGTAMLERIIEDARLEGAHELELVVGDTNPARRLYERVGFTVIKRGGVGPFARRFGFKELLTYKLQLVTRDAWQALRAEGAAR